MRALFSLAAFLSSALLFAVQPLAARLVLPTFGGSPQVWNTSLVFFQAALLLGYLWAHIQATKVPARVQRFSHVGIALFAAVLLPISNSTSWFEWIRDRAASTSTPPVLLVLAALAFLVGLPFFALSTNSSTLQRWYSTSGAPDADRPYFLYAAGNVGSLLALLGYPFLIESRFTLREQGIYWAGGYAVLLLLLAACAVVSRSGATEKPSEEAQPVPDLTHRQRFRWVAFAAVPSSLLMGVTTYLTTNIAPIPLLWVVPLALYLLTFILVFARKPMAPAALLSRIFPLILTPLVVLIVLESDRPVIPIAALHLTVVFIGTWMCHSRLTLERPNPKHLTEFFFWMSFGGVLGGSFNALVAPVVFSTLLEYPAALVACAMLMTRRVNAKRRPYLDVAYPVALGVLMFALIVYTRWRGVAAGPERTFLTIGFPAILCFLAVDHPFRFGLSLAAGFLVAAGMHVSSDARIPIAERSFFGVHRVTITPSGRWHKLVHGNTVHGMQDMTHPERPLTYYHRTGPIGQVMEAFPKDRVALVGLGVGSLAAYGRKGQKMTFFEIDPKVAQLAQNPRYFRYLSDSKADIDIVLGDARLTLARQQGKYGLIALDAFSSDAIPIHLLTVEAMKTYLDHLEDDGVLAIHISNRYLELAPVVKAACDQLGVKVLLQEDAPSYDEMDEGKNASNWLIVGRRLSVFDSMPKRSLWDGVDSRIKRPWTDDYSNVVGVFRDEGLWTR